MKYFLPVTVMLIILTTSACRKETVSNRDIIGSWRWKSSNSSAGVRMLSNDTSKTYNITFRNNFSFSNTAFCIVGGLTEGTFQVKNTGGNKILILKTQNNGTDSLNISVDDNHLLLTETSNNYSWFHDFYRE